MKVGQRVRTIDGREGAIETVYFDAVGYESPIDKVYLKGCGLPFYRWQLTPIEPTPAISLEVSRLKWAWGEEPYESWCANRHTFCADTARKNGTLNRKGCTPCEWFHEGLPLPAPSPWRKARIRRPTVSATYTLNLDGHLYEDVEIQIEGE